MSRILITGSSDGLGRAAAEELLRAGHAVVVHVRSAERLAAVKELLDGGAQAVVGDLARLDEVRELARQANALGRFDAVIHNAGVFTGPAIQPVNVVAPFVLTAEMERPQRLIYLSSGMHRGGHTNLSGMTGAVRGKAVRTRTASSSSPRLWPRWRGCGRKWPRTPWIQAGCRPAWVAPERRTISALAT